MKKKIFIIIFFTCALSSISLAQVKNKKEAAEFLNFYCLELVKTIESSYYEQVEATKLDNWKTFMEKGRWIEGVSRVYSNLCK